MISALMKVNFSRIVNPYLNACDQFLQNRKVTFQAVFIHSVILLFRVDIISSFLIWQLPSRHCPKSGE